jgi:hypothetical protein
VQITYSNGVQRAATIAPGASTLLFQPADAGLPTGWQGSATVRSTNGRRLVAVGNVVHTAGGRFTAYNAPVDGSAMVTLPALYNGYAAAGYNSSVSVQNVDAAPTTVQILYSDGTVQTFANVAPGASVLVYQPNVPRLSRGWQGSASVKSAEGRRLVAAVHADTTVGTGPAVDTLSSYVGFLR